MITLRGLDYLKKKATKDWHQKAIEALGRQIETYRDAQIDYKDEKKWRPGGYVSSSERDIHYKRLYRAEATIKSLKRYLDEVSTYKSKPLIFYYIMSRPMRVHDYYHGTSQDFMPFESVRWRRKYIKEMFR
jgi:hypothetical protein